jgi:mevalonate pyrophosphate decarboxylase
MAKIIVDDTVFRREIREGIIMRINLFGDMFDERMREVERKRKQIERIVDERGTIKAFYPAQELISSLRSVLIEVEPAMKGIMDSAKLMSKELDKAKEIDRGEE